MIKRLKLLNRVFRETAFFVYDSISIDAINARKMGITFKTTEEAENFAYTGAESVVDITLSNGRAFTNYKIIEVDLERRIIRFIRV